MPISAISSAALIFFTSARGLEFALGEEAAAPGHHPDAALLKLGRQAVGEALRHHYPPDALFAQKGRQDIGDAGPLGPSIPKFLLITAEREDMKAGPCFERDQSPNRS